MAGLVPTDATEGKRIRQLQVRQYCGIPYIPCTIYTIYTYITFFSEIVFFSSVSLFTPFCWQWELRLLLCLFLISRGQNTRQLYREWKSETWEISLSIQDKRLYCTRKRNNFLYQFQIIVTKRCWKNSLGACPRLKYLLLNLNTLAGFSRAQGHYTMYSPCFTSLMTLKLQERLVNVNHPDDTWLNARIAN